MRGLRRGKTSGSGAKPLPKLLLGAKALGSYRLLAAYRRLLQTKTYHELMATFLHPPDIWNSPSAREYALGKTSRLLPINPRRAVENSSPDRAKEAKGTADGTSGDEKKSGKNRNSIMGIIQTSWEMEGKEGEEPLLDHLRTGAGRPGRAAQIEASNKMEI